jgi:hypothetical protein
MRVLHVYYTRIHFLWYFRLMHECSAKLSATMLQPPSFAKHPCGTAAFS